MTNYSIIKTPGYEKDLGIIPQPVVDHLQSVLQMMENDPFDSKLKARPLHGALKGKYRLHLTMNYRLIYTVSLDKHRVFLQKVEHRGSVYRMDG